jgi:hypothetical protein
MIKKLLKELDFISVETTFFVDGAPRYRNLLGGIISLIIIISTFGASLYFITGFLAREGATIIANEEITDMVRISNFSDYPIMMRISAAGNKVIQKNFKVWKVIGQRWWTTNNYTGQFFLNLNMVPCDIEKHFGSYRYLFENIKDLDTFICPEFPAESDLYGLYGGTKPYSFYNFAIRPCIADLDGNICESNSIIKSFLNQVFLDVRTVDFLQYLILIQIQLIHLLKETDSLFLKQFFAGFG